MKIGILFICLNPKYWPFAKDAVEGAQRYLLPNHERDFFIWSDMPDTNYGATIFETEPVEWPLPTLMRYHLFTQQEDVLKKYDYLFYCDIDMKFVDVVGDEILGNGITAVEHPMYALRKLYIAPYEPNLESAAYIPVPSHYFAGGFQGGKTEDCLKASWTLKRMIDQDFVKNYIARWNDESHWNRYLFDNPPSVVLSPAYCYPETLIKEHYIYVWGRDYKPKIITLNKRFTMTVEAGKDIIKELEEFEKAKNAK